MLKNYLLVFFISMVPIVELRGAIPIGLGLGLPALPTYFLCVLGNMLPVPFIYLFARKFLIWGYHKPLIGPICRFCINKGEKGGRALEAKAGRGLTLALLLFVGIPLPGTGAWTGTLAGSILELHVQDGPRQRAGPGSRRPVSGTPTNSSSARVRPRPALASSARPPFSPLLMQKRQMGPMRGLW